METNTEKQQEAITDTDRQERVLTTRGCTGGGTRACSWSPAQRRQEEESQEPERARQVTNPLSTYGSSAARTAEGSLSEKASRQMLQASSQASWTPPSTKAAADECFSIPTSLPPRLSPIKSREPRASTNDPCNTNAGSGSGREIGASSVGVATPKPTPSKQ